MSKATKEAIMVCEEGPNGPDLFIVFNGQKIAKHGYPDTPQACTWIPLEPGFAVYDNPDDDSIAIEQGGAQVQ